MGVIRTIRTPDEAKSLYALEMDYIHTLKSVEDGKGYSWFVGNCVVMHNCINAIARHMGIRDKVAIDINKRVDSISRINPLVFVSLLLLFYLC